jgi:hypothetical protein
VPSPTLDKVATLVVFGIGIEFLHLHEPQTLTPALSHPMGEGEIVHALGEVPSAGKCGFRVQCANCFGEFSPGPLHLFVDEKESEVRGVI